MSSFFKTFFYFSKGERRGIVVLLFLAIGLGVLPWVLPYFAPREVFPMTPFETMEIKEDIDTLNRKEDKMANLFFFDPNTLSMDSLLLLGLPVKTAKTIINYRMKVGRFGIPKDLKKIYTLSGKDYQRLAPFIRIRKKNKLASSSFYAADTLSFELKVFDPNTASKEELLSLGFPSKVCTTLLNFRKKGGRFYKKQDLKLIYGLKSADYDRLAPFIELSKEIKISDSTQQKVRKRRDQPQNIRIDINDSSAEDWQQLYGIGPAYAKRITNFRDKLGGFSSIEQIAMTYGLPDSTFQKIKPYLVQSPIFRLININTATEEELKKHPLIKWKEAKMIINYREQHGPFLNEESLKRMKGISSQKIEQLIPYFSFE